MKKYILLLAVMAVQSIALAANKISGRIVDDNDGSALIGANVVLKDAADELVTGVTTDENGDFELSEVRDGNYTLTVSYIGYEMQHFSLTNLNRDVPLGEIRLTASSTTMNEVEVTGQAVIHKTDRQLILPTAAQKKASNNGITLLQRMQVPGLSISPLDKSVSTNFGESVQLRINGVEATKEEVIAIRPSDVLRIEYHDNPGLRYGNVAGVVDYIVKRREHGGYVSADLEEGVTMSGYGDYNLSGKYYYNKSSFSITASMNRRDLEWNRENTETFLYPDHTLVNEEIGSPTAVAYTWMNLSATYSYTNGKKSLLNITFRNKLNDTPHGFSDRDAKLYQEDKEYHVLDRSDEYSNIPSLDLYYQLNLKNNRHLYFDVVGTYLKSDNQRTYSLTETGATPVEIFSKTEGDKYSLIGEMIYEQPLGKGKFSTGLKHNQSYMSNVYDGNVSSKVNMNTAETYLFAEYQGSVKKLGYSFGIGGTRTYYKQKDDSQEKFILRPTLTLSYKPTDKVYLKYKANLGGYAPSLSNLSDVEQNIDAYQVRRGNPYLRSATYFTNNLSVNLQSKYVNVELYGRYSYDHKPIMEETLYEDGKFIRTYDNQKGLHRLNLQTNIKIRPYKEYLSISLTPFFNRFISNGNSYTYTHSNWGFRGNALAMYKNWMLMYQMSTSYHTLEGETLQKGESMHILALGYNKDKWSIQAMVLNPFTDDYHMEVANISRLAPNRQYAYSNCFNQMIALNVSFNLSFGKQQKDTHKRINNSDTDTGILSGSK